MKRHYPVLDDYVIFFNALHCGTGAFSCKIPNLHFVYTKIAPCHRAGGKMKISLFVYHNMNSPPSVRFQDLILYYARALLKPAPTVRFREGILYITRKT